MLHPDASKRVTVAQIRRHCWCATPIQALTRQLRQGAEHSILVSDNAEDDMYMAVALKVCSCGQLVLCCHHGVWLDRSGGVGVCECVHGDWLCRL